MANENIDRTTVSLPLALSRQFKAALREREMSIPEGFKEAISLYLRSLEVGEVGAQQTAQAVLDLTQHFKNYYQEKFAEWRLARTKHQINGIAAWRLELDAWPADIYLMNVLSELLLKFDQYDYFFTVTNLQFWDRTAAVDDFYLNAQMNAIKRGMGLQRVFLLDKDEDAQGLKTHLNFLRAVPEEHRWQVKVTCIKSTNFASALARYGHFACIQRRVDSAVVPEGEGDCLIVEPIYNLHRQITHLKFLFSEKKGTQDLHIKPFLDRIKQLSGMGESIDLEPA